jgi:hypothetical protein
MMGLKYAGARKKTVQKGKPAKEKRPKTNKKPCRKSGNGLLSGYIPQLKLRIKQLAVFHFYRMSNRISGVWNKQRI